MSYFSLFANFTVVEVLPLLKRLTLLRSQTFVFLSADNQPRR